VIVGDLAIFWRAPPIFTQFFLIFMSVMIAMVLLGIPDWTIWILLILLVFYDAIVVLCPHGLLNILVKKSEERGDEIPALVYSSAPWHSAENESSSSSSGAKSTVDSSDITDRLLDGSEHHKAVRPPKTSNSGQPDPDNPSRSEKSGKSGQSGKGSKKDREGIRLGLGDFAFYGILVTRAARLGWDLVILCVFAVILGLSFTLLFLVWLQKPLPARPFSLILVVIFFLTGAFTFRQFFLHCRTSLVSF
jgi:hypothetical protein